MFELRLDSNGCWRIESTKKTCRQRIPTGNPEHVETTQSIKRLQS
jgi:hypothetical protein